jgi:site-specific recombinase XerD
MVALIVRQVGEAAGLKLSAEILRQTCLPNLVRDGNDIVRVAEIAGHTRLQTTRHYPMPSAHDRDRVGAMEQAGLMGS